MSLESAQANCLNNSTCTGVSSTGSSWQLCTTDAGKLNCEYMPACIHTCAILRTCWVSSGCFDCPQVGILRLLELQCVTQAQWLAAASAFLQSSLLQLQLIKLQVAGCCQEVGEPAMVEVGATCPLAVRRRQGGIGLHTTNHLEATAIQAINLCAQVCPRHTLPFPDWT